MEIIYKGKNDAGLDVYEAFYTTFTVKTTKKGKLVIHREGLPEKNMFLAKISGCGDGGRRFLTLNEYWHWPDGLRLNAHQVQIYGLNWGIKLVIRAWLNQDVEYTSWQSFLDGPEITPEQLEPVVKEPEDEDDWGCGCGDDVETPSPDYSLPRYQDLINETRPDWGFARGTSGNDFGPLVGCSCMGCADKRRLILDARPAPVVETPWNTFGKLVPRWKIRLIKNLRNNCRFLSERPNTEIVNGRIGLREAKESIELWAAECPDAIVPDWMLDDITP